MPGNKTSCVAVTGLNAGDSPAPGVPVIRSLIEQKAWNGRIVGLAYDALDSGALDERACSSVYLLPYPGTGKDVLFERLMYIRKKEGINAVIPTLDAELPNFIALREDLAEAGIATFLPTEDQFKRRLKQNLDALCNELGIRTPKTRQVMDPAKLGIRRGDCPVMVKGLYYEAYLAHSPEEAAHFVQKIAARWGYPVLVQDFIEGEEYNAAAVGDGKGAALGIAGMKKLVFTDKGKGWACVSIDNRGLTALAAKIIRALKWRGAIEVEAILSKKDGCFYLIELNPRFPAWIYLATAAGMNLPSLALALACGRKPKAKGLYQPGVVFTNYTTNLITSLGKIGPLFTNGEVCYEKTV